MAERFTGAGLAAKPTINLSTDGGTVVGTTQLDGSQQINLVAGTGIILTGTSPDSITIQSTGGGGGGSVTAVTTTLSGITITNPTTTPEISGTLGVSSGGTGTTTLADGGILLGSGAGAITVTAQPTDGQLLIGSTGTDPVLATLSAGSGISITEGAGSITIAATGGGGSGTVTSVDVSGGTTGLTYSGGPITTSGTITMAGTLAVAHGGTGSTTASGARTNLGLGTMATQNANAVAITGGTISGVSGVAPSVGDSNQFNVSDGSGGWDSASVYYNQSGNGAVGIGSGVSITHGLTVFQTGSNVAKFKSNQSTSTVIIESATANNSRVGLKASNNSLILMSNSVDFSMPTADGTNGDVLTTDGAGTLSFNTPSGISGSGTAQQVTFWDGSASVAGDTNFTYNPSNDTLILDGNLQISDSQIDQGTQTWSAGNQGAALGFGGISVSDFRSCKYLVQITDTTTNDFQVTELLLLNNGSQGIVVEYATLISGSAAVGVDFDSSQVLGQITPNFTINNNNAGRVDFIRTILFQA